MHNTFLMRIFGVGEGWEYQSTKYVNGGTEIHLKARKAAIRCPISGSDDITLHGTRERRVRSVPIGFKHVTFVVHVPRCFSRETGKFFDFSPSFAPRGCSYTLGLARFVAGLFRIMSMTDLAAFTGLSWDTVKRIASCHMAKDVGKIDLKKVHFLSIDEVYLGKLHKFITIVINWESGQILYVAKGKGENALRPFFRRLRMAKAKIKAVSTDLSAAYAAAVRNCMPKTLWVADRFHVIKLMNEKISKLRCALQREADTMGRKVLKGTRYLLLRGRENLKPERIPALEEALKLNEPLSQAYYLKEDLRTMWDFKDIKKMTEFFDDWCRRAKDTGVPLLASLGKTLRGFRSGILNGWVYPISNGKLEGINNKIGAMQRMHYGLRDFTFLSLRLLTLHKAKRNFCG